MAGRAHRPLPAVPTEESDYLDPGFEDGEFSDGEDYKNVGFVEQSPDAELPNNDDDDDYLLPEASSEGKPLLPPRQPSSGRIAPPPPRQVNVTPDIPPRNKPQPSQQLVLPPRRISDPLSFDSKRAKEKVSRPHLPAPIQPPDGHLEPGKGEWDGPTEDYSEIPGGVDQAHNAPLPPQLPDDLCKGLPKMIQEEMNMSSMQREMQAKILTPSKHELPPTPTQPKVINGFQMVQGIDSLKIKNVKGVLRPVTKHVFEHPTPKRETIGQDPSVINFRDKTAMFEKKVKSAPSGQKMAQTTALRPSQTLIREKACLRGSTTSNTSNRSDSGVDISDTQDIALGPSSPLQHVQLTLPKSAMPQCTTSVQPPSPSKVSIANRTLPPLPAEAAISKTSLSSRPLPCVPNSHPKDLSEYPWFFANLKRYEEQPKILALKQDGVFLVRESTRHPESPCTLSILFNRKIWHLHIRKRPDGKFAIGSEKQNEHFFDTIPELVEYHRRHSIILAGKYGQEGQTRLIKHPNK